MMQSHAGDVTAPHVIGTHNLPALHRVRVAGVCRVAVRCPRAPRRALPLQPHRTHEPRHVLAVHLQALTPQEGSDTSIALGRPFLREPRDRGFQRRVIAGLRAVVIAAARGAQDPAALAHGIGLAEHLDYLARIFDRWCKTLVAFFRRSFSSVKRPTNRSSSALRPTCWLSCCSGVSKSQAARERKMVSSRPRRTLRSDAPGITLRYSWSLTGARGRPRL
jgi:hypothetical protein